MGLKEKEKFCLSCGEPIKGRTDKKFCDDQCRSNYNNRLNSENSVQIRIVNNILKKNRKLLEAVVGVDGKGKISKQKLMEKGFNFKYFTQMHTTQKGSVYKLCYEYAYLLIENDFVFVVKWENEK
jgi:predicted nucleic acid-binding Zn ribbon protein